MNNLKIGIIEDDLLIAESIVEMLKQCGYKTSTPARSYSEAIAMIEQEAPDLLLIDIMLDGQLDGINLAKKVREEYYTPFIFITANSDHATVQRAKDVRPYAYLIKPFNERDLYSTIEIALSAFNFETQREEKTVKDRPAFDDFIFIKEHKLFHKVMLNEILHIESENVYLNVFTEKRTYLVRSKLNDFIGSFTNPDFFRVHRSHAINIKHLQSVNSLSVTVGGREIPLQNAYKQDLLKLVRSI